MRSMADLPGGCPDPTLDGDPRAAGLRRELRGALARVPAGRLMVTTSFGPGGIVLLHALRRMEVRLPVVFVDTLHHLPETLAFARELAHRWALDLHVEKAAVSREAFEAEHGARLWETDLDAYHRLTKVEPLARALVGVEGWITARRRDQSESRAALPLVEEGAPLKFNPLAEWTGGEVWDYIRRHDLPYNPHELGRSDERRREA